MRAGCSGTGGAGTVDHFGLHGAGRHPGGHALEGHRRARRLHRRPAPPDRVAGEPRQAVPVLHERPAVRGRGVHRGARRDPRRARPAGAALVQHDDVQGAAARPRLRHRRIARRRSRRSSPATRRRRRRWRAACSRRVCSVPPSCSPPSGAGKARVRTIVTADHTEDDLREASEAFARVGRELELIA